jgi:putative FmdB family regulatory protein
MPIYEYRCSTCNRKFDILHKSSVKQEEIICPSCGSTNNKKLFSAFSSQVSGGASESFGCENGACAAAPHQHSGGCCGGACGLN